VLTVNAPFQGANDLQKTGAGTLVLTADNLASGWQGGVTLSEGTLQVANASGSATGSYPVVLDGGILASASGGAIQGVLAAGSGAHVVSPGGDGAVGSLTVGGLYLNANTTLHFDISGPASLDQVHDNYGGPGPLARAGSNGTINVVVPTGLSGGQFVLIDGFDATALTANDFRINDGVVPQGYSLKVDNALHTLSLVVGPAVGSWTSAAVSGRWSEEAKWTGSKPIGGGAAAVFAGGSAADKPAVQVDVPVSLSGLIFGSSPGPDNSNYTLTAAAVPQTLTLANDPGSGQAVSVRSGSHLIEAPVLLASTTTRFSSDSGTELTISGDVGGPTSVLEKDGPGRLVLSSGNNSYGAALVNGGELWVSALGAWPLGTDLTIGAGARVVLSENLNGPGAVATHAAAVPEPGALGLVGAGVVAVLALAWRRGRRFSIRDGRLL
jgi:autotransporter-associated beta strand protein